MEKQEVKKTRKSLSLEIKMEVLQRFERGERNTDISKAMGLSDSTVRTIRGNGEIIRKMVQRSTDVSATRITKARSDALEKMERLLAVWIEHQNQQNCHLSMVIIREKAKSLYKDLTKNDIDAAPFAASDGWFGRFKKRNAFYNLKMSGEGVGAGLVTVNKFPVLLKSLIYEGSYTPQQVFNIDETGLFWRRLPSKMCPLDAEEKLNPGFRASRDRCTLLMGGNAWGDYKIKPLMVYHSDNPKALKNCLKHRLPVIWRSNSRASLTSGIFSDYFVSQLEQELKSFCEREQLPFKILLLVDSAPSHPPNLTDLSSNIKVMFIPGSATSQIQPMEQGVFSTFKAYYLRRIIAKFVADGDEKSRTRDLKKCFDLKMAIEAIGDSWTEVTQICMNGVWKKIWPEVVFGDFDGQELEVEKNNIVQMAHRAGFVDVDVKDVEELLQSHNDELTNEDLMALENERLREEFDVSLDDRKPDRNLSTKDLAGIFRHLDSIATILEDKDSDRQRSAKVIREANHVFKCYKELYLKKKESINVVI